MGPVTFGVMWLPFPRNYLVFAFMGYVDLDQKASYQKVFET